jgi:uncharacterized membrane protein YbaN (DUF454 family)
MIRKAFRNTLAAACLLIGIAGLFLPFIQGIAMIVLAVFIADFEAKERLLERHRHTRLGGWLWERHEARKARNADEAELKPAPPATGKSAAGEE